MITDVFHASFLAIQPADGLGASVHRFQMAGLAQIDDVNDPVSSLVVDPVADSGHVRRAVGVSAVRFDDGQRNGHARREHDLSAVVLLQLARFFQHSHRFDHQILVERLSAFGNSNVQSVVNLLKF